MTTAIIRGIWGNALLTRRHERAPDAFHRLLQNVVALKERGDRCDAFYCFGDDNEEFLTYHNFLNVRKIHRKSWASPKIRPDFHHRWDGAWIHGVSYWWHKLKILEKALEDYDAVLWIDVDLPQNRVDIPLWFWQFLDGGAEFKASLYLQRNWTWGAGWRHSSRWNFPSYIVRENSQLAAQTVPGCGLLYCRDLEFIREALEIQEEHCFWLDHQVFAFQLDRRHGGWVGNDEYLRLGYHTAGYYYGRQVYPSVETEILWGSPEREGWHVKSEISYRSIKRLRGDGASDPALRKRV